jgi:hypothetical protein
MRNLHGLIKLNQVLGGLNVLVALSVFHVGFFYATAFPGKIDTSPVVWGVIYGFILLVSDLVWSRVRQDLAARAERVPGSSVVWYGLAISTVKTALFTPLVIVILAYALVRFAPRGVSAHALLNPYVFALCATIAAYVIARAFVMRAGAKGGRSFGRMNTAKLRLDGDGFELTLSMTRLGRMADAPPRPPIHIGFDEISELRSLSFSEATMVDTPGLRRIQDMMDYAAGKIERPSVYMEGPNTGAETLYFCGSGLQYLLPIDTDSLDPVLVAFERFQAGRRQPEIVR